jgi:hypothetical protein
MTDEQRAERIRYHLYESNEGIQEHAERIVALEELCLDMWFWCFIHPMDSESQERQMLHIDAVIQRMRELGVEVNRTDEL